MKTKTSLITIATLLVAIATTYLIATNDQILNSSQLVGVLVGVGVAIWIGVAIGRNGVTELVLGTPVEVEVAKAILLIGLIIGIGGVEAGAAAIAIGVIVGIIIGAITYNKKTDESDTKKILTLASIFLLPILVFTIPLSKHYNMNQLDRDTADTEILKVKPKETTLPKWKIRTNPNTTTIRLDIPDETQEQEAQVA